MPNGEGDGPMTATLATPAGLIDFGGTDLLRDLRPDEISAVLDFMILRQYPRGATLFHARDSADCMYLLLTGTVKIAYLQPGGDERIISIFQAGDIFGALFIGKYRHRIGTATALEAATVARLDEQHLERLMARFPHVGMNLIRHLADEQRETLARLHALTHSDARYRLLGTLLYLARRYCCTRGDWFEVPACITQDDLANLALLNRSTVNVQINDYRREGILGGKGRRLRVNRPAVEAYLRDAGLELLE